MMGAEYMTLVRVRPHHSGWRLYRRVGPPLPCWMVPSWLSRAINRRLPARYRLALWVRGSQRERWRDESVGARGVW